MSEPATLTIVTLSLAVVLTIGLLLLARRVWPVDDQEPYVRLLGAYSPILTWLKYRRLPKRVVKPDSQVSTSVPGPATAAPPRWPVVAEPGQALVVSASSSAPAATYTFARKVLSVAGPLALAAVPAGLVVGDRWLNNVYVRFWLSEWWCGENPICVSALPSYFLVVIPCLLLAGLWVYFQADTSRLAWLVTPIHRPPDQSARPGLPQASRIILFTAVVGLAGTAGSALVRGQSPGLLYAVFYLLFLAAWTVGDWPRERVAAWWAQARRPVLAAALAHISLVAWLASHYSGSGATALAGTLCLLAFGNLWRHRREIHQFFWLTQAALIIYCLNLNAWWLAVIGDEFSFFTYAAELARGVSFQVWNERWFSGQAVYGSHPFFSSFLQAVSMKLLGVNNFGWRFSSLYLSAAALPLFYVVLRRFVQRPLALLAVAGLAASHYLMSFGKIGYNNLQAYFVLALVLAAAAWAGHRPQRLALVGFGASLGLCFYVYPAALYAVPIGGLLYAFCSPLRGRAAWRAVLLICVSFGLLVAPLLWQPGYWQEKVAGTLFHNADLAGSPVLLLRHLLANLGYSILSFLYLPHETHFVGVGFTDPVTATLLVLGLAVLLRQARLRFAAFLLTSLLLMLGLVGASHDREFPPVTRMFLLLPWFCFLAALGLYWLWAQLGQLGLGVVSSRGVVAGVMISMFALNVYQAYGVSRQRFADQQRLESLYLRVAQSVQAVERLQPKRFLFITDPAWGIDGMYMLQDVYKVPTSPSQLEVLTLTSPVLTDADRALVAAVDTLVIPKPWLEDDWLESLGAELAAVGKESCPIRTEAGNYSIALWHAPDFANFCSP